MTGHLFRVKSETSLGTFSINYRDLELRRTFIHLLSLVNLQIDIVKN